MYNVFWKTEQQTSPLQTLPSGEIIRFAQSQDLASIAETTPSSHTLSNADGEIFKSVDMKNANLVLMAQQIQEHLQTSTTSIVKKNN